MQFGWTTFEDCLKIRKRNVPLPPGFPILIIVLILGMATVLTISINSRPIFANGGNLDNEFHVSEPALESIKTALDPQMSQIRRGGLGEPDDLFVSIRGTLQPLLSDDRKLLIDIGNKYPILKRLTLMHLQLESGWADDFGVESMDPAENRKKRLQAAMRKYSPLMLQEALDRPRLSEGAGMVVAGAYCSMEILQPTPMEDDLKAALAGKLVALNFKKVGSSGMPELQFKTDKEVDDQIRDLERQYGGKTLRPENMSTPMLGLRYCSADYSTPPADKRIPELQNKLSKLGYKVQEEYSFDAKMCFESREKAIAFLQKLGIDESKAQLERQIPQQLEIIYPVIWKSDFQDFENVRTVVAQESWNKPLTPVEIDAGAHKLLNNLEKGETVPLQYFHIYPGSKIDKTGDRRWHMDVPERWFVTVGMHSAVVTKL